MTDSSTLWDELEGEDGQPLGGPGVGAERAVRAASVDAARAEAGLESRGQRGPHGEPAAHGAQSAHGEPATHGAQSAHGEPATHGAHSEHEVSSLREMFRERRLSLRSMEPRLRLATAGALAGMLGVALLLVLRDSVGGGVDLGRSNGVLEELATPLFIATLVLMALGFAYVLTGAVLASWPIALAALLAITVELGLYTGAFGHLFGSVGSGFIELMHPEARWTSRGLLIAVWVVAVVVFVLDRRRRPALPTRRFRLTVLGAYVAIFGLYLGLLRVASPSVGGLDLFPTSVSLMMADVAILVGPVLTVAAVDFGEWGSVLGERVGTALRRTRHQMLTPVSAVLSVSLVVGGYVMVKHGGMLSGHRLALVAETTGMLAVALALVLLVGKALRLNERRWPSGLNFAGLFAVAALILFVVAPVSGWIAGYFKDVGKPVEEVTEAGHFTPEADVLLRHGGGTTPATSYSLLVPRGWQQIDKGGLTLFSGPLPLDEHGNTRAGTQQVIVTAFNGRIGLQPAEIVFHLEPEGELTTRDGWQVQDVHKGRQPGMLWVRQLGAAGHPQTVFMLDLVSGTTLETVKPTFEAIAGSFRPPGVAPATLPHASEGKAEGASSEASNTEQVRSDRLMTVSAAISGAITVVFLLLIGTVGRRWPPRLVGSMLLFGLTTLATVLFFSDEIGHVIAGASSEWHFVGMRDLLAGVGVLSVLALLIRPREEQRRQRLTVALIGFQATVWTLYGMSVLYDHALSAGRVALWAAIILLLALGWDVVMSGESMTNRSSSHLPRPSRVLAFMGYVLLVAGAVLFFSGQREIATGQAGEPFFEPEATTQNGLFRFAFPLAVLLLLLRWNSRGAESPSHAASSEPADARSRAADPVRVGFDA